MSRKIARIEHTIEVEEIAYRLQRLKREKGMTQDEIADAVGVVRQTAGKWLVGISAPDAIALISLSKLFDVSTDYILGLKEREK